MISLYDGFDERVAVADWEKIGQSIARLLLAGGDLADIAVLLAAQPGEVDLSDEVS